MSTRIHCFVTAGQEEHHCGRRGDAEMGVTSGAQRAAGESEGAAWIVCYGSDPREADRLSPRAATTISIDTVDKTRMLC